MRILFLGDVMGRSGREGLAKSLPELKERFSPEVVIANVENAAAGRGVTGKLAQEMLGLGINCLTSGNHVWEQKGIIEDIENEPRLLRPLNHVEGTPGKGSFLHVLPDGRKILIANVMGCLFINAVLDNPFSVTEKFLQKHELGREVQAIFMDFHAEASSEKMAFAHNFDGRVSAVIGTHTHIPTADAHILPRGTAFMSDVGMCGDYDSVIGVKKDTPIRRFFGKVGGERMSPAEGEATVCGCFVATDDATGKAVSIVSIRTGGILGT